MHISLVENNIIHAMHSSNHELTCFTTPSLTPPPPWFEILHSETWLFAHGQNPRYWFVRVPVWQYPFFTWNERKGRPALVDNKLHDSASRRRIPYHIPYLKRWFLVPTNATFNRGWFRVRMQVEIFICLNVLLLFCLCHHECGGCPRTVH